MSNKKPFEYYSKVSTYIVNEPRFTDTEFRILVFLCQFSKVIRPTKAAIMDATGIKSVATVTKALKALRALNVLKWSSGRNHKANTYYIQPVSDWQWPTERDSRLSASKAYREALIMDQLKGAV